MRDTLRDLLVGLVVCSMVTSAFVGFVGTAAAATHVVDASGGGDFTTIQAAVDAASPGDTVRVRAGTYDGGVVVDKPLTIVGDPGDAAAGSGPDAPVLQNASGTVGFEVRAGGSDTTIRGFEFRDYREAAVYVVVRTGATLSGVTVEQNSVSNTEIGLAGGVGLADVTVAGNRFTDGARFEIDENAGDRLTMTGVDVSGNVFVGSQGDAIDVDLYASNADVTMTVRGNTIVDARGDGIEFELHPEGTYDITVEENVVDRSGHEAVEFLTNSDTAIGVRIVDNELLNSGGNAVELHDGDATGFTVSGNAIVGNAGGIVNGGSGVLDARDNYWESSDGPSEEQLADESVDVTPYATEPIADEPEPNPGATGGGPQFVVGDASVSTTNPVVGQDVTISVPVTNEGGAAGTFSGMFRSDFTGHDSVSVGVDDGETVVVRTTVRYGDKGSYNLYLDDHYVGELDVSARDPMRVNVTADPANDTVDAAVENPRRTDIGIDVPATNASHDSGVVLTNVQVTPRGIDDFTLSVTQSAYDTDAATGGSLAVTAGNDTDSGVVSANATAAANATDTVLLLPDGTAPVSGFAFDSSLSSDRIESVVLTVTVDTSRYPSLADATVGDTLSMYRYDAATGTYAQRSGQVVETANGSLTATVTLDGFSTYVVGVDRGAFDVSGSLDGSPATAGGSLSLALDVTNTGDGPGRYSPAVAIAGTPVTADGLTLAAGETGTLVVEVPASTPGVWPVTVGDRLVAIAFVEPAADED